MINSILAQLTDDEKLSYIKALAAVTGGLITGQQSVLLLVPIVFANDEDKRQALRHIGTDMGSPFCDNCEEPDCKIGKGGICSMIRKYRETLDRD